MSLMPCSAATLMMWSSAFMWTSIFTASRIRSLTADTDGQNPDSGARLRASGCVHYLAARRSRSETPRLPRCSELARWAR